METKKEDGLHIHIHVHTHCRERDKQTTHTGKKEAERLFTIAGEAKIQTQRESNVCQKDSLFVLKQVVGLHV